MPVFKYDTEKKQMVKVSDRSYRRSYSEAEKPLSQVVMDGYKRVEAMGQLINGKAGNIKRIWNN